MLQTIYNIKANNTSHCSKLIIAGFRVNSIVQLALTLTLLRFFFCLSKFNNFLIFQTALQAPRSLLQ